MTLTSKQTELLETIKSFRASKGFCPSNADLAKTLGVSTVRIFQQIKCLEIAGAIKVMGKKSIQIDNEIPYTEKQFNVMQALIKNPNASQTEIARIIGIALPTLQQEHFSRLQAVGAIEIENGKVKVLDKPELSTGTPS